MRGLGDHPRSRGVYKEALWAIFSTLGSSPLARGLPALDVHDELMAGIIPARAGFTERAAMGGAEAWDHPRSRGVYPTVTLNPANDVGSSPLARGLPEGQCAVCEKDRIIPARAGFTPCPACATGTERDHPRSRGVYLLDSGASRIAVGSSPLARGLRRRRRTRCAGWGIIPARAGFTHEPLAGRDHLGDHPRSRGVYPAACPTGTSSSGSSPLARGLLGQHRRHGGGRGIIPARAGFTRGGGGVDAAHADHPRSRGVYRLNRTGPPAQKGSSPLARGLRDPVPYDSATLGIIPARAGFTPGRDPGAGRGADHPRSRGVYQPKPKGPRP